MASFGSLLAPILVPFELGRLPGGSRRLPEASWTLLEAPRGFQGAQAKGWLAGLGGPEAEATRQVEGKTPDPVGYQETWIHAVCYRKVA